jgi:hypothetical protein
MGQTLFLVLLHRLVADMVLVDTHTLMALPQIQAVLEEVVSVITQVVRQEQQGKVILVEVAPTPEAVVAVHQQAVQTM